MLSVTMAINNDVFYSPDCRGSVIIHKHRHRLDDMATRLGM